MDKATEYREQAEDSRATADRFKTNDEARQEWLEMAAEWDLLADERERLRRRAN